ncbi:universal stress protein [Aquimarina algiphila]|uniref:Universal stress protein n=1 Tax=Aquimarina algiphila TaxID=2047982 RepID=A0A554VLX4_9FLAO|nr:universal stress protein [Aquimarina algiphila]TSE09163.1 universal stress protein [Aquimarina algiphila]
MKQIVVPIDFSDNSNNALQYAKTLFSSEICTFYLLNVYISNPSNLLSKEYNDSILTEMSQESEKNLKILLNKTNKENDNNHHNFEIVSRANTLVNAINHMLNTKKIDFITMGAKGTKGMFLGSNTVKVINGVENCPLLVVPQSYIPKKPSLIAFSTNFKRTFVKDELNPLIDIALSNHSKINIARIMIEEYLNDYQKVNKETLKVLFKDLDYIFCKIDVETSETNALKEFATQTESDLIALVHHKHNFFQKLMEEDVVDKITFNSPLPLLILPELKLKETAK